MSSDKELTADPLTTALDEEMAEIAARIDKSRGPDDSDMEWYARIMAGIEKDALVIRGRYEYELAQIQANYEAICKELDRRRAAAEWKWGLLVRQLVADRIKGKKQRHVKTLWGKLRFKRKPAKENRDIIDQAKALAWAEKHCPSAITTRTTKTVRKGDLPFDCPELQITTIPETDEFFFEPAKLALEANHTPALPEPEGQMRDARHCQNNENRRKDNGTF